MGIRQIIALFMGLVFQVSHGQQWMVAESVIGCGAAHSESMSCCKGLEQCPCISKSDGEPQREPLTSDIQQLKVVLSSATEKNPTELFRFSADDRSASPRSHARLWSGYGGVPLNVAYCKFVI